MRTVAGTEAPGEAVEPVPFFVAAVSRDLEDGAALGALDFAEDEEDDEAEIERAMIHLWVRRTRHAPDIPLVGRWLVVVARFLRGPVDF
jgi:hypothetical protein